MLQSANGTAYIGCVGKDENATRLKESASKSGVAAHFLEDEKTPTGTCAVLVNGKDRSLVANIAAANNYKEEHLLSKDIWAVVEKAKVFYISGFFLTVSVPSILAVGKHAAEQDKV
jgi:adenosine kinase